jgi:hypothetical protein
MSDRHEELHTEVERLCRTITNSNLDWAADAAKAEIEAIGQLVGCGHTEGLATCVRQHIEELEYKCQVKL